MGFQWLRDVFEVVIVLSTATSAFVLWRSSRTKATASTTTEASSPITEPRWNLLRHPLTMFLIVCFVIFVNQIAFNAYVLRAHGGNPSFVARYLPSGWFALSRGTVVRFVASHVGDAQVLAPSVLNVQAFLELPFVLTAYLAVAKMLGGRVYHSLTRLPVLILASISFTITFSLVELSVPNPWTSDDVTIRAIAGVIVPLILAWITRSVPVHASKEDRPRGVLGLFAFLAGSAAMAWAILAIYDSFLLYNFGHLDGYAVGLVIAATVMIASAWAAPRIDALSPFTAPSLVIRCARDAIATFTVVFFVPSLVLRYQAYRPIALLCGTLIVAFAFVIGLRRGVARAHGTLEIARIALCAAVGLMGGFVAAVIVAILPIANETIAEERFARVVLTFLALTVVLARSLEIVLSSRQSLSTSASSLPS